MGMYHNRHHVEDIRKMKMNGEKISMLQIGGVAMVLASIVALELR